MIDDFIHDLTLADLPADVIEHSRICLLDLVGVAAAGSTTALSAIIREHVVAHLSNGHARLLFDGRAVSPPGAALANASTIDAMDGHDGHRLTKGHAGAAVLPAVLALLPAETGASDLLVALVVGYEIANRAGMALHATASEYHSSGAWNALGAAAAGARLLGLDRVATAHAMGIAEYHAPRAPMMRGVDHPTMVKDSSGWGAHAGVSAVLLAANGFTGAPADLLAAQGWSDLGRKWTLREQYLKPYPVCRWAHPAVTATLDLVTANDIPAAAIAHIEVTTFHAAACLATRVPATTEQAQYSLPFPVAVAAARRALDPGLVARPTEADYPIRRLAETLVLQESLELTAVFPGTRRADVTIQLHDGRRLSSGPTAAPGDPENPLTPTELDAKFRALATPPLGPTRVQDLLKHLHAVPDVDLNPLLDKLYAPQSSALGRSG